MSENQELLYQLKRLLKQKGSKSFYAKKLGISLGGVNYCLNALIEIGHIKAGNFSKNPNKSVYLYL